MRLNRRGATLPLSVIVLALMAVALAITHARISSERHISGDNKAQLGAFAVAQSGLSRFLATINGKPALLAGDVQTVTYNDLPGGTARVDLVMLRESTTTLLPAVYVITSRGTYTAAKRYDALTPAAERTVATYALWKPASFDLNGAFTSLNESGVRINGAAPRLSGVDRCGTAASIPGVASPNAQYLGDPVVLEGNPAGVAADLGTPGAGGTAVDEVDIDWAAIRAGTELPGDYVYPTWPTSTQFAGWPVTRVNGDLNPLPSSGKGLLIVTGNLVINGSVPPKTWEGLILVGGTLTGNGASNIYGAVITGLNVKLGLPVDALNDLGNGTKYYQYDSCALTRALGRVGSIQRVRNGWTDTWPSY
jgi:hypothetical protein